MVEGESSRYTEAEHWVIPDEKIRRKYEIQFFHRHFALTNFQIGFSPENEASYDKIIFYTFFLFFDKESPHARL